MGFVLLYATIVSGDRRARLLVSCLLRCGSWVCEGEGQTVVEDKKIDQEFADAGWETDGSFSEHLAIGESRGVSILAHLSTWQTDAPTYELYDVRRNISYWVHEVPTPEQAAELLEEHGEPPDEEE